MLTEVRGFIRIIDDTTSVVAPVRVAVPVLGVDAGLYVHIVSTPGGGGTGFSVVDLSAFTVGVSQLVPTGGVFNDALVAVPAGDVAEARITSFRALHTNLRDNSGNEIGVVANPLHVDVDNAVTVSGTVAVSSVAGNVTVIQPTGTNLHVVIDSGTITTITNPVTVTGTVAISGMVTVIGTDSDNAVNSTTKIPTIPARANAADPAWTEGHEVPLSTNLAGYLRTIIGGNVTVVQPTGTNLHVVVDSGAITVSGTVAVSSVAGNVTVIGTDSDNAVNSTTKLPTIPARANAADPVWTEGHEVPLSVNLAGYLRTLATVSGTVTISGNVSVIGTDADNAVNSTTKLPVIVGRANAVEPTWTEGHEVPLSTDLNAGLRVISGNVPILTGTWDGTTPLDTAVTMNVTAYGNVVISGIPTNLTGGSVAFEASDDGVTYFTVSAARNPQGTSFVAENGFDFGTSPVSLSWQCNVSGYTSFRVRLATAVTVSLGGSLVIKVEASSATMEPIVIVGQSDSTLLKATVVGPSFDNSANTVLKLPVLPARANAAAPTWNENRQVPLSTDLAGSLRTTIIGDVTVVQPTGTNLHVVVDSGTITVSGTVSISGNVTVVGTLQDNTTASAAYTAKVGTLPARANAAAPAWTEGNIVPLSTDLAGNLRVSGSFTSATDISPATQNITIPDTNTITTTQANGQIVLSATPTVGSAASFVISTIDTIRVEVTGTWEGTLRVEMSLDGGTLWYPMKVQQPNVVANFSEFTENFSGSLNIAGGTNWRIRCVSDNFIGTATVQIVESLNLSSVVVSNSVFVIGAHTPSTFVDAPTDAINTQSFSLAFNPHTMLWNPISVDRAGDLFVSDQENGFVLQRIAAELLLLNYLISVGFGIKDDLDSLRQAVLLGSDIESSDIDPNFLNDALVFQNFSVS